MTKKVITLNKFFTLNNMETKEKLFRTNTGDVLFGHFDHDGNLSHFSLQGSEENITKALIEDSNSSDYIARNSANMLLFLMKTKSVISK